MDMTNSWQIKISRAVIEDNMDNTVPQIKTIKLIKNPEL